MRQADTEAQEAPAMPQQAATAPAAPQDKAAMPTAGSPEMQARQATNQAARPEAPAPPQARAALLT
jgi:hypothetical protein